MVSFEAIARTGVKALENPPSFVGSNTNQGANNSTTMQPTTTTSSSHRHVYTHEKDRHEEVVANEFGQVIQKRRTLSDTRSFLDFSDRLYLLRNSKDAWLVGAAAGLATLWACGRVRGSLASRVVSPFRTNSGVNVRSTMGLPDLVVAGYIGFYSTFYSTIDPVYPTIESKHETFET